MTRTFGSVLGILIMFALSAAAASAQEASMAALDETLKTYAAAWGEPDEARRRAMVESVWAPQGTYTDPQSQVTGRDGLLQVIAAFLEQFPGARIVLTSRPDIHHGMIRFTWKAVARDGTTIVEGVDFGVVGSDGRLEQIVGFFGPLTPL